MENKINEETVKKDIARLKFSMQENNIIHNSYQREKRELECIRQGDMEGMEKCITEPYGGKLGTLSRDVLRSDKNVQFSPLIRQRSRILFPLIQFLICWLIICNSFFIKEFFCVCFHIFIRFIFSL